MTKSTKKRVATPEASAIDPEVIRFRSHFEERSSLDEIVRDGAQRMLQSAIEEEVNEFLLSHDNRRDEDGNRLVVRNCYLPGREAVTGAGNLHVEQPRVRDNLSDVESRVRFTSKILPPHLRKSNTIEELIPGLYLKGISTGDLSEALEQLLGEPARGFSPNCNRQ